MRPVRVTLVEDGVPAATAPTVALAMTGNFVPVAASVIGGLGLRPALPEAATAAPSRATVHESIYATALKNDVPADMIRELVRIMSFDVDFQRPVSPGDSLDIFFSEDDVETGEEGKPTILYAAINVRGETHEFYRFRTPDDGFVDYYDSAGKSAKKFLVRKPMTGGVFRSGFGMRRHPILGYRKMHSGVDWAAPRGTPIVAAGNGTVEFANWKSGYGKHVAIRHANGYTTTYSHMSGFAQGMAAGVRVRQGQVIGYVGSTGLSTGNHLHYEVIVNGRFVDPMRIRLPRGRVLDGRYLAAFEREKQRIEALRMKPPASTRLAAVSE